MSSSSSAFGRRAAAVADRALALRRSRLVEVGSSRGARAAVRGAPRASASSPRASRWSRPAAPGAAAPAALQPPARPRPVATTVTRISFGHLRIDHRADHDGRVLGGELLDDVADFLELADRQVHAGGDVHEDAVRARQVDVLEQRARTRPLSAAARARSSPLADAGAHHRHAGLRHHGAHVGEVDVDEARTGDQLGDALHGALQHLVGAP